MLTFGHFAISNSKICFQQNMIFDCSLKWTFCQHILEKKKLFVLVPVIVYSFLFTCFSWFWKSVGPFAMYSQLHGTAAGWCMANAVKISLFIFHPNWLLYLFFSFVHPKSVQSFGMLRGSANSLVLFYDIRSSSKFSSMSRDRFTF